MKFRTEKKYYVTKNSLFLIKKFRPKWSSQMWCEIWISHSVNMELHSQNFVRTEQKVIYSTDSRSWFVTSIFIILCVLNKKHSEVEWHLNPLQCERDITVIKRIITDCKIFVCCVGSKWCICNFQINNSKRIEWKAVRSGVTSELAAVWTWNYFWKTR